MTFDLHNGFNACVSVHGTGRVHTSKNVSLVHVVCAEDGDSAGSAALQQRPHLVSGAGVHACCGLVQEKDLTKQA